MKTKLYDIIIVGAGFSGLASGIKLKDLKHNNFLILEADNRVGGRSLNKITFNDTIFELGGQWIGHDHQLMHNLVQRF